MPLGFERINARVAQPNINVNFIKPLKGPDEALAKDFLERIAAICSPIMKTNYLAVMSLEEYEPNSEFLGRNFNSGEIIQLVLKSRSGHWLPFRFVQMVMMHELAHCKQMNHSKAFWKVKEQYSEELKLLWSKSYTGEGMWSRGVTLNSGEYMNDRLAAEDSIPEHLCGGTYQSSRRGKRKRKSKPQLSYKEKQEQRISKKFGTNGVSLGADEDIKVKLEKGKKQAGKPRVAGSNRGRELRAAAALARFEVKKETEVINDEYIEIESGNASETESDYEAQDPSIKTEPNEAIDINGQRMLDIKGHGMVKVCEDEDKGGGDAQRELDELRQIDGGLNPASSLKKARCPTNKLTKDKAKAKDHMPVLLKIEEGQKPSHSKAPAASSPCQICSATNHSGALTCIVCSNVLDCSQSPNHWRCHSDVCKGGAYINSGDCALCGACGSRRKTFA